MPRTSPYSITLADAEHAELRHRILMLFGPGSCCTRPRVWATTRSRRAWTHHGRWCPSGANASTTSVWPAWPICLGEDGPRVFPPDVVVAIKALACELPAKTDTPRARWQSPDLARAAVE